MGAAETNRMPRPPAKTRAVGAAFFARVMGLAALLAATVSAFARSAAASAGPDTAGGEASLKLPDLSQVKFLGIDGHKLLICRNSVLHFRPGFRLDDLHAA